MVVIKGPHRSDGILEGVCQKCTRLRHFQIKELQNCVGKGLAKLALSPNLTPLAHQTHGCSEIMAALMYAIIKPDVLGGPH